MNVHEINQTIAILNDENLRNNLIIEASGGITLENISSYGKTDLDIISLGFITHSIKNLDLSLDIVND
jgi:nicotinate-nucleotide pyrophosphorylase (carboxylating)